MLTFLFLNPSENLISDMTKNVTLELANKVFVEEDAAVLQSFADSLKENFNTVPEALDFDNKKDTVDKINHWASQATHGKIAKVADVHSFPDDASLLVMNAIYLKGKHITIDPNL